MLTVCSLVCPRTWSNAYSRCSMLRLVLSTDSGDSTLSPKLWCHCIGYESQNVFSSMGGPGPPISSRQRSRIPWTVHLAVRSAESIITLFFIIQPTSCPASSSLDCWCKGGRASSLEQFARWHYVDWQSASFRHRLKNYYFVPSFVSRRCLILTVLFSTVA